MAVIYNQGWATTDHQHFDASNFKRIKTLVMKKQIGQFRVSFTWMDGCKIEVLIRKQFAPAACEPVWICTTSATVHHLSHLTALHIMTSGGSRFALFEAAAFLISPNLAFPAPAMRNALECNLSTESWFCLKSFPVLSCEGTNTVTLLERERVAWLSNTSLTNMTVN